MSDSTLSSSSTSEMKAHRRRAVVASTVGTTIEWYDFFLYGTAAALVFPQVFFPGQSQYAGALASFATLFVGFAARPIGAAIFGHYGDRVGRKATLIMTLMLMGTATFLIGCLPGVATIGVAAPILLTLLRVVQGMGVGGEWGGSVLMSMEWGAQHRRGLMASWPQLGVPLGLLLSTAMVKVMSAATGPDFVRWGWRVPFLASFVLVGIGLYVRLRVMESPTFTAVKRSDAVVRSPVLEVRQAPAAGGPHLGVRASLRAGTVLPVHHVRAHLRHREALDEPRHAAQRHPRRGGGRAGQRAVLRVPLRRHRPSADVRHRHRRHRAVRFSVLRPAEHQAVRRWCCWRSCCRWSSTTCSTARRRR